MATRLIINGDDFGFSTGVTDGIRQAHQQGILTSTTLLVTTPDAARAMEVAQALPKLAVGIHLCLTQGRPCLVGQTRLLSGDNHFPPTVARLLRRLMAGRRVREEVRREWAEQIETALKRGLKPTHLDSHKHIHHWPPLADIAIDLARRYGIAALRCAHEVTPAGMPAPGLRYRGLVALAGRMRRKISRVDLRTTDWFFGLAATGQMSVAAWLKLLAALPPGTGEIMVHPGDPRGLNATDTRLLAERQWELDALCDPAVRAAVKQSGAELTHYGQLT